MAASFPVVLVTGGRQVGKTTLLKHMAATQKQPMNYVSLDDFGAKTVASSDPALFFKRYPPPIIVDEIQNAPFLLGEIKSRVDASGENGRFWLSGSQSFPVMRSVSESLAGRVAVVELMGFSRAEAEEREASPVPFRPDRLAEAKPRKVQDLDTLFEQLLSGAFPRLALSDAPPRENYFDSYIETYLERDVRSMVNISNLSAFRRFLRIAAARTGQILNYSGIASDTGVSVSTIREWIGVLEATYQIYLLRPYFENIGKRQIKSPKLYFADTGLACHLSGWNSARAASVGSMAGAIFETHVVSQIVQSYRHRGRRPPIWFYRDREKREVDVIIAEDGTLFPIEIKLGASPGRGDLRGIEALNRAGANVGRGAIICLVDEPFPVSSGVDAVPPDLID